MKRSTFSLLFIVKRNKLKKNGEAPVFLRITINGKVSEFSIKRTILPDEWDSVKGCSKKKTEKGKNSTIT